MHLLQYSIDDVNIFSREQPQNYWIRHRTRSSLKVWETLVCVYVGVRVSVSPLLRTHTWRWCLMLSPQLALTVSWSLPCTRVWAPFSLSDSRSRRRDKVVWDHYGLRSRKNTCWQLTLTCLIGHREWGGCGLFAMGVNTQQKWKCESFFKS